MVGQMFMECGFETEVSKVVKLVRGSKEIDVYAQDNVSEHKMIILVECKYWNTPVNQEVVHAFRTVINDFGAHVGYIVSKKGFQSGCYEVAYKTNLKLVTLEEFEKIFHSRWRAAMIERYLPYSQKLLPYWFCSCLNPVTTEGKPIDHASHLLLSRAYGPICDLNLSNYFELGFVKYPLTLPVINEEFKTIGSMTIHNDREYFDFCEENKDIALQRHKALFASE